MEVPPPTPDDHSALVRTGLPLGVMGAVHAVAILLSTRGFGARLPADLWLAYHLTAAAVLVVAFSILLRRVRERGGDPTPQRVAWGLAGLDLAASAVLTALALRP
jgi:lysylphosphatidylglycerol synthetase-like protein (DUF2156 family)